MTPADPVLSVAPDVLTAGGSAQVSISNGPPGEEVTVDIDDGGSGTDSVKITLDQNGNGSTSWSVPDSGWDVANFNAEGCDQVTRLIEQP